MAAPTLTYTLTNATNANANHVQTNLQDLLSAITDGTKDLTIGALVINGDITPTGKLVATLSPKTTNTYALGTTLLRYSTVYGVAGDFSGAVTVAGTATFNGAVTLGDATGDDLTATGRWASSLVPKTTNTYDLGTSSLRYANVYGVAGNFSGAMNVDGATTLNGTVTLGDATGDDITVTGRIASSVVPKTDDTYDLGTASLRYRVAYSDEVNFGQTVAGNITKTMLDWYEEGTWTTSMVAGNNSITSGTTFSSAAYTRIGRYVQCRLTVLSMAPTVAGLGFAVQFADTDLPYLPAGGVGGTGMAINSTIHGGVVGHIPGSNQISFEVPQFNATVPTTTQRNYHIVFGYYV